MRTHICVLLSPVKCAGVGAEGLTGRAAPTELCLRKGGVLSSQDHPCSFQVCGSVTMPKTSPQEQNAHMS